MISTSFLLSPVGGTIDFAEKYLHSASGIEVSMLAPKLLLLCWGSNLILFLGRKEKKAVIENWPVLSRNTICFPSPQLAIKLDGLRSRAGTSHPKLKACIPRWSEVKSFDPALRTEEPSSVSAPQIQTSTTQGGTEDAAEGCSILWEYNLGDSALWGEERHHGAAGGWGGCEYELWNETRLHTRVWLLARSYKSNVIASLRE